MPGSEIGDACCDADHPYLGAELPNPYHTRDYTPPTSQQPVDSCPDGQPAIAESCGQWPGPGLGVGSEQSSPDDKGLEKDNGKETSVEGEAVNNHFQGDGEMQEYIIGDGSKNENKVENGNGYDSTDEVTYDYLDHYGERKKRRRR